VLYLDSSALAKKYIREKGSEAIQQKITAQTGAEAIAFTSVLTYAEILAAFTRRAKEGTLSSREVRRARQDFETDWAVGLAPLTLDSSVLLLVRDVLLHFSLKGSDAIHLASALWLRDAARTGTSGRASKLIFATSDTRLGNAAVDRNLEVFNPELS
jgi:predicted nucleic acid-binding protein